MHMRDAMQAPGTKIKAWRVRGTLIVFVFFSWLLEAASGLWALVPAFSREDVRVMYVISPIGPRTLDQAPVFAC